MKLKLTMHLIAATGLSVAIQGTVTLLGGSRAVAFFIAMPWTILFVHWFWPKRREAE